MTVWKRLAVGAAATLGLVLLVGVAVYLVSERKLSRAPEAPVAGTMLTAGAASIERGRHIAVTRGCAGCHMEDFGGQVMIDVPVFAVVAANNLTGGHGGLPADYDDADWDRAIRHGIGRDERPLALMPSQTYFGFSDDDTASLIAYLRSLPPVDRELPERAFGPVGRSLVAVGRLPMFSALTMDHSAPRPPAPQEAPTPEFGRYLASICTACHGPEFTGGRIPGSPPDHPSAPNLTPNPEDGIGAWTEADFFRALRQGQRPDGTAISPRYMPWGATARMTDTEIQALWVFLRSLPERAGKDEG